MIIKVRREKDNYPLFMIVKTGMSLWLFERVESNYRVHESIYEVETNDRIESCLTALRV